MTKLVSSVILFTILFAYSKSESQKSSAQNELPYIISPWTSYKVVGDIKDLSYASIKRIEVLIAIPKGRTQEQVEETLKRAAYEIAKREKPKALVVKAFSEEDQFKHGSYTAGEAIWAPDGKWENAGLKSEYKVTIKLGKIYF